MLLESGGGERTDFGVGKREISCRVWEMCVVILKNSFRFAYSFLMPS